MSARRLAASAGFAASFILAYLGTVAWMSAVDNPPANLWLVAVPVTLTEVTVGTAVIVAIVTCFGAWREWVSEDD